MFMKSSVCTATYNRYQRAWFKWTSYCLSLDLLSYQFYLDTLSLNDQRQVLVGVMRFQRTVCLDSSGGVNALLSGIRFEFVCHLRDVSIFDDPIIKQAKKALSKFQNVKDKARTKFIRYPFPIALLFDMRNESLITIDGRANYTATLLAFHLLMRVGEYAYNGERSVHVMMCDAVLYDVSGLGLITAPSLRQLDYDFVVTGVMVIFRGDKTHPEWKETYHYINHLNDEGASDEECKLVDLLIEWALFSKVKETDSFFTRYEDKPGRRDSRRSLRTSDISAYLNLIAEKNNLDKGTFKPHSLRAGAAAEMFRSNIHPATINHSGRWRLESPMGVSYGNKDDRVIGALSNITNGVGSFTLGHIASARIPRRKKSV